MTATAATFTTISLPVVEAASRRAGTLQMECGGLLHFDSAEYGPEHGEVSVYSGTERYIMPVDAQVQLVCWGDERA